MFIQPVLVWPLGARHCAGLWGMGTSKTDSSQIWEAYPLEGRDKCYMWEIKQGLETDGSVAAGPGPRRRRGISGLKERSDHRSSACKGPAPAWAWCAGGSGSLLSREVLALNKSPPDLKGLPTEGAHLRPHTARCLPGNQQRRPPRGWHGLLPGGARSWRLCMGRTGPHCEHPTGAVGKQKARVCPGRAGWELRRAH